MAARKGTKSKYRHIYGEPAKPEFQFLELKNPLTSGEGSYVKANAKFFAVSKSAGGGPVYVRKLDNPGRFKTNVPMLAVHKGKVLDIDFHPFIETMLGTASEDCRVAVTSFPSDGLTETISEPSVLLEGHQKKVALLQFNPSANSILASASFDRTVKVWNIEKQTEILSFEEFQDNIYSLEWNHNGSLLGTTSKDKNLRLYDPRNPGETLKVTSSFDGAKSSKVFWAPRLNWIGATGFSKTSKRQLKIWDLNNLEKPVFSTDIDQGNSVLLPYYDNDTGVLYLAGKGTGSVTYFELQNDERKLYNLGLYRSTEPQKGGGWVSKRGLNVWKCEVGRFLKLTSKAVIPISFIVPRKAGADVFQEDIFPDAFAGKPALTGDEWEGGENKDPITSTLDPKKRTDDDSGVVFKKKASYAELAKENLELKARIKELEAQLGITSDEPEAKDDAGDNAADENADAADDNADAADDNADDNADAGDDD